MGAPVLIGAGIGALGSTLMGGSPLRGALLGGSLGSGYGGIKSLMEGGSFLQGASPFSAGSLVNGIGTNALAGGDIAKGLAINSSMLGGSTGIKLLPTVDQALSLSPVAASSTGAGALTGGAGINLAPMATFDGLNIVPTAASKIGITDLANYATGTGTNLMAAAKPSFLDSITSQQVSNVIGGANIASQYMQPRPIPQAPAGGVSRGNPPPAAAVQELIAQIQAQQPRRRLSLLVG